MPTTEIRCPVQPPNLDEIEMLRILGSARTPNVKTRYLRDSILPTALRQLKGARLDFLLITPIVVDEFWRGAGIYDHLEQDPINDNIDSLEST